MDIIVKTLLAVETLGVANVLTKMLKFMLMQL